MNAKPVLKLGVLLLCFSNFACVTTSQFAPVHSTQAFSLRTPAEKIEIFRSQAPTKKYLEIGTVNSCCGGDSNILVESLRKKASESGGDAIIGLELSAVGGAFATVIRYEDTSK